MDDDDNQLIEKRLELRQKLKTKLLTLSPSHDRFDRFHRFIPNFRDNDFLEKQGLDSVMNYLTSDLTDFQTKSPTRCSQCQSDSTENWWRSMADGQTMVELCDPCEQTRVRRFIVQQHRESMKSAFLQAKESERRLQVDFQKQNINSSRSC